MFILPRKHLKLLLNKIYKTPNDKMQQTTTETLTKTLQKLIRRRQTQDFSTPKPRHHAFPTSYFEW